MQMFWITQIPYYFNTSVDLFFVISECYGLNCVSSKLIHWNLNLQRDYIQRQDF